VQRMTPPIGARTIIVISPWRANDRPISVTSSHQIWIELHPERLLTTRDMVSVLDDGAHN